MSDLINRSQLLKEIEKYKFGAISNDAEREYIKKTILDFIICQQTAYSVDKVVDELEERTDFMKDCKKYGNNNAEQQKQSYSAMMMYEVADLVDDLIEIVKHGGLSDDVCEWKFEDEETNLYLTGCQQRQLIFEGTPKENGYRYCPYCGKKIKVVE